MSGRTSTLAQFLHRDRYQAAKIVMNVPQVRQSADQVICLLFPQRGCHSTLGIADTEGNLLELKRRFNEYVESVVTLNTDLKDIVESIVDSFFEGLPELARALDLDVMAAYNGDPAAYSKEEIIITYPGFYAVCMYRIAHSLHQLKVPLIPRLLSEYAHEKTGIDIHPGAGIGEGFFIDHGTGVVIGETAHIGKNVKIYQGVTLGALSVKKKMQSIKRHPTIENDVVIYANSTILGGETVIGAGSVIGGNTWIVASVEPYSIITVTGR